MPLVSTPRPARLLALAAFLAAAALSACGDATGPRDPATPHGTRLAPKSAHLDETVGDTTANRPTIPWY